MLSSSLRANRGRLPTNLWRLCGEQLEDRLVLAGATGENVLQLFSTSSALFVENQGQWTDESVRYAFHGAGANFSNDFPTSADAFDRSVGNAQDAFITKLTRSGSLAWSTYLGGNEGPQSDFGGWDAATDIAVDAAGNVLVTGKTGSLDFPVTADAFDQNLGGHEDGFVTKLTNSGSLAWSTYLGGSDGPQSNWGGCDEGRDISSDASGNVLVTGATASDDFPTTTGAFDRNLGGYQDAFVTKLTSDGRLDWSTYLGGSDGPHSDWGGFEEGVGISVDVAGHVFVTGSTSSDNFPTTTGGLDRSLGGDKDAFITKLTSGGRLSWSTFLGGSEGPHSDFGGREEGIDISLDVAGNVLVTGSSSSIDFPTTFGAYDRGLGGDGDAFVTKLTNSGSLAWSTYLGGSDGPHSGFGGWDFAGGIAVDAAGNVLVTGMTWSRDFPTTSGAFDKSLGEADAFITKLTRGGILAWSTYLGGSDGPHSEFGGRDAATGIAIAAAAKVVVTGPTWSHDFPTTGSGFDQSLGGDSDAFVAVVLIRESGDANLDGIVDARDFNIWSQNKSTGNATWSMGDFNADGLVDHLDFNIWNEDKFTQPSPGPIVLPRARMPRTTLHRDVIVAVDSIVQEIRDFHVEISKRNVGEAEATIDAVEYLNAGWTRPLRVKLLRRESDFYRGRNFRFLGPDNMATDRAFEELFVTENTTVSYHHG